MTPDWKKRADALRLDSFESLFHTKKPVIGMVHCWPLPGSPNYREHTIEDVREHALRDVDALVRGGVDAVIVENMWDTPYRAGAHLRPESIASHAVIADAVGRMIDIPLGINVVHNGGEALLAIAIAARASFIRVCMFTGAGVWDAGDWDQGCAADLMRRRAELNAEDIKIFADVDKKHSVRFPGIDLATHIEWTEFFGADAMIVSGRMTGDAPGLGKIREAKRLAGARPILVGSGADATNVAEFLSVADGVIVGTSLKYDGVCENPVDAGRVREFVARAREAL